MVRGRLRAGGLAPPLLASVASTIAAGPHAVVFDPAPGDDHRRAWGEMSTAVAGLAGGRHPVLPPACGCSPCRTRRRLTGTLAKGRVRQSGWARSDLGAPLGKLWHPRPHAQRGFLGRELACNLCRELQSKPIGATNPLQGSLSSSSKSRKISALAQMREKRHDEPLRLPVSGSCIPRPRPPPDAPGSHRNPWRQGQMVCGREILRPSFAAVALILNKAE